MSNCSSCYKNHCGDRVTEESVEFKSVQVAELAATKIDKIISEMGVTIEVGIGSEIMVARPFTDKHGKPQEAKVVLANVPF